MDELKMERTIRETMKTAAERLEAPDQLKTRIDFALRSGEAQAPARRRPRWGKKLAAVCLVAALAVTGAVAGSGAVTGWYSSSRFADEWNDFSETAEYMQEYMPDAKYIESFSNGFVFEKGCEQPVDKRDESNNTIETFTGINLTYKKGDVDLIFGAEPVQEDASYSVNDSEYGTNRMIGDVKVHYYAMPMIVLSADAEPTAEEQAAFDRGEINIAWDGANTEREDITWHSVSWIEDGISYRISTLNPGDLTENDFFQMAQEVIEA